MRLQVGPVYIIDIGSFRLIDPSVEAAQLRKFFGEAWWSQRGKKVSLYPHSLRLRFAVEALEPSSYDRLIERVADDFHVLLSVVGCSEGDFLGVLRAKSEDMGHITEQIIATAYVYILETIASRTHQSRIDFHFMRMEMDADDLPGGKKAYETRIYQTGEIPYHFVTDIVTTIIAYLNAVIRDEPFDVMRALRSRVDRYLPSPSEDPPPRPRTGYIVVGRTGTREAVVVNPKKSRGIIKKGLRVVVPFPGLRRALRLEPRLTRN